jgi:hypothetical protein
VCLIAPWARFATSVMAGVYRCRIHCVPTTRLDHQVDNVDHRAYLEPKLPSARSRRSRCPPRVGMMRLVVVPPQVALSQVATASIAAATSLDSSSARRSALRIRSISNCRAAGSPASRARVQGACVVGEHAAKRRCRALLGLGVVAAQADKTLGAELTGG